MLDKTPAIEPEALTLEGLRHVIEEIIPFNRLIGFRLTAADREAGSVELALEVKDEHIGNAVRHMVHGGLLAALVDSAAGAAVALTLDDVSQAPSVATIDMRVDFLRPARGRAISATAKIMRSGRSVVVVRTDVHDEDGELVALGSSTFTVERDRPNAPK